MIVTTCPHCQKKLKIEEELAGTEGRCPACQQAFTIPTEMAPPETLPRAAPPPLTADDDARPAATPPPMPPKPDARPSRASVQRILEDYRKTSKPAASTAQTMLKGGVRSVKERARAIRLKHDIKSLHTALDQQWEQLGTLTLEHRPDAVDVNVELTALSRLRNDISEKEVTLGSLQKTKGSGSVVRQLRREVGQLRTHQRELMIAIGRKAEQVKPEFPEAAGHYSAIHSLRASLDEKERELDKLEERLGPIVDSEALRGTFRSLRRPLILGGVVGGGLAAMYILWVVVSGLFLRSSFSRYAYYVPDNAQAVAYVNVDKLRETEPYEEIEDAIPAELALGLGMDRIAEVLLVALPRSRPLVVFRTTEQMDLEDLPGRNGSGRSPYKGIEYVCVHTGSTRGFVAKTGKRTFCLTPNEDDLRDTLRHLSRKRKPALDEDLQRALNHVDGRDHYAAVTGRTPFARECPSGMRAAGAGCSIGSSVNAKALMVFGSEGDAEKAEDELASDIEEAIDEVERELSRAEGYERELCEAALDMLEALSYGRRGNSVSFSWKYSVGHIMALLDELEDIDKKDQLLRGVLGEFIRSMRRAF